jgi:hypothetical protein
MLDAGGGCIGGPALADLGKIHHSNCGVLDPLTAMRFGVLSITTPEYDDVLVAHQWASALKVGRDPGPAPRNEREVHRRRLAVTRAPAGA